MGDEPKKRKPGRPRLYDGPRPKLVAAVPQELFKRLQIAAVMLDRSQTDCVIEALESWLEAVGDTGLLK